MKLLFAAQLFLLTIVGPIRLALSLDTGPLHHRLSKREILKMFGVNHHSEVPNYETTVLSRSDSDGLLRVKFRALNDHFHLKLRPNERLLSPDLVSVVRNGNSSQLHIGLPVDSDCHFVGEVESHKSAPVALSGCPNLKGLMSTPDGFLIIHPLPQRFLSDDGHTHVVFRRSAGLSPFLSDFVGGKTAREELQVHQNPMKEEDHFCDVNFDNVTLPKHSGARVKRFPPPPLSFEFGNYSVPIGADNDDTPVYSGTTPLTIEMGVFLDNKLWEHFIEDFSVERAEQEMVDFSLSLINNVYVLYQQPSLTPKVDIVVVRFEIWKTQPDDLAASKHKNGHAQQILDKFCGYQSKLDPGTDSAEHWDHATLLTGFDLYHTSASVAGVAPVARMCDKPFSCSVVEGLHLGRSFVLAHEMGHNLGMVHDGVQNRCNSKCCLMSPINGAGKTTWSNCSVKEMNAYLNNLGTQGQVGNCLADKPSMVARNHKTDGRLPGQRYTPDQQCSFFWGRDYKNEVPSGGTLGEICNILWCGNGGSSISTAHPALEGSYCGDKQWCVQGLCTPWASSEAPQPVVGSWSGWTDLPHSQCSQCEIIGGLKVRRQLRICDNPAPNNGGPTCPGSEFRGSLCPGSFDCTGYTKVEYGDRICTSYRSDVKKGDTQLTGKSFAHPDSPCKLWCHLEGSDLIRNKAIFPDGTPCGSSQYCVNGKCLSFACNNKALVASKPDDCPDETGAASWTRWTAWTSCSASCGSGVRNRQRSCQPEGRSCVGNANDTENCRDLDCSSNWSNWAEWTSCSLTCGVGARSRNRTCAGPKCDGSVVETATCGSDDCPQWSDWSLWSVCSISCGSGGKETRQRSCKNGQNCVGLPIEDRQCGNSPACPSVPSASLWAEWADWAICSLTCGGGTRQRDRQCPNGNCDGTTKEVGECNSAPCPTWSSWFDWSSCSATCGLGQRTKSRSCRGASAARFVILSTAALSQDASVRPVEKDCPGPSITSENCNLAPCGDPNAFSSWQLWSTCTKTCGGGSRLRVRDCISKDLCSGQSIESEDCNTQACSEGKWSVWSSWSACSSTCGEGRQDRPRFCLSADSRNCRGFNKEERSCNSGLCQLPQVVLKADVSEISPIWSSWTAWSGCSCFSLQRVRRRYCNIRRPEQFGFCLGSVYEESECQPTDCSPTAGSWSEWGDWSKCSENCSEAKGEKIRYRVCANPYPINRGAYCHGKPFEMAPCAGLQQSCSGATPVSGGWADWTDWTGCSSGCGMGLRSRTRYCSNPPPKNGGKPCSGVDFSMEDCVGSQANCASPIDGEFGLWSEWSACGAQCGFAFRNRSRLCNNPKPENGGRRCRGLAFNTQVCPLPACQKATDGQWNSWSSWGFCSVNCGFGQQTRTRNCDSPTAQSGGIPCLGSSSETQSCTNGRLECQNSLSNGEVLEDLVKNWEMYRDLKPKRIVLT